MNRYLKQLPTGWVVTEAGTIRQSFDNGGSCELIRDKDGKGWVVLNTDGTGSKWAQWHPSFKQLLEAVKNAD
jgi:hypothetical protein